MIAVARARAGAGWSWRRSISLRKLLFPAVLLVTALPLLAPTIPPLVDLPNHMSRYRIGLDYVNVPDFRRWFEFHWVWVGNLGVDLPIAAIAPTTGLELAVKLVVLAIPLLTVAGMALVAYEAHGRVPATAPLAFPFAYGLPFNFGFVNFCLSAALALLALGLWARLGRLGRQSLRTALFVPVGLAVWTAHAVGWGMLGVMIFAWEMVDRRTDGLGWIEAGSRAAIACLPLAAALAPMLAWYRTGAMSDRMLIDYDPIRKLSLLAVSLKNQIAWLDLGCVMAVWAFLGIAVVHPAFRFDRRIVAIASFLLAVFLTVPDGLIGSGYVDLRLAPFVLALAMLAIRPDASISRPLGVFALALFAGRMIYVAESYAALDRSYQSQLVALDHLPEGARVFGLAEVACLADFADARLDHLNRMAIVRRRAFTNDTWPPAASQTLKVREGMMAHFHDLDSQKLVPTRCPMPGHHDINSALAHLPRNRFDYLWLIGVGPALRPERSWLRTVWRGEAGALYRILPPGREES